MFLLYHILTHSYRVSSLGKNELIFFFNKYWTVLPVPWPPFSSRVSHVLGGFQSPCHSPLLRKKALWQTNFHANSSKNLLGAYSVACTCTKCLVCIITCKIYFSDMIRWDWSLRCHYQNQSLKWWHQTEFQAFLFHHITFGAMTPSSLL